MEHLTFYQARLCQFNDIERLVELFNVDYKSYRTNITIDRSTLVWFYTRNKNVDIYSVYTNIKNVDLGLVSQQSQNGRYRFGLTPD